MISKKERDIVVGRLLVDPVNSDVRILDREMRLMHNMIVELKGAVESLRDQQAMPDPGFDEYLDNLLDGLPS